MSYYCLRLHLTHSHCNIAFINFLFFYTALFVTSKPSYRIVCDGCLLGSILIIFDVDDDNVANDVDDNDDDADADANNANDVENDADADAMTIVVVVVQSLPYIIIRVNCLTYLYETSYYVFTKSPSSKQIRSRTHNESTHALVTISVTRENYVRALAFLLYFSHSLVRRRNAVENYVLL